MTGIERLRKLSEDMLSLSLWVRLTRGTEKDWDCCQGDGRTVNDELLSIADQIEREQDAMVADSPYEALPPEDREAIAWVREHGGLDHVKAEWRSRVPYNKYERARRRLLGHIAECETALGRRNVRIEELGHRVGDLRRENAELRKRAMPEGMEWMLEVWPRWSNGEHCRLGDWWTADRYGYYEPRQLRRLVIYTPELLDELGQGDGESYGYVWDFMRPSELDYRPDKVEPPAPAVPAADGEPLEVGQTVWHVDTGDEFYVSCFSGGMVNVSDKKGGGLQLLPSQLTHTKPEPPESWERIEEDIAEGFMATDETTRDLREEARDIVRRCRALAERERGASDERGRVHEVRRRGLRARDSVRAGLRARGGLGARHGVAGRRVRPVPGVRAQGSACRGNRGGVVSQSKWVRVGSVRRFDNVYADKAQALKPLEEAAEVFGAWQRYGAEDWKDVLLDECADVIQATLNLMAALGVEDFRPYLKACERRNRERGRITDGKAVDE